MSVLMSMSFQPRNENGDAAIWRQSELERQVGNLTGGAAEQAGTIRRMSGAIRPSRRPCRLPERYFCSAVGADTTASIGDPTIPGPPSRSGMPALRRAPPIGALANDLARTFAKSPRARQRATDEHAAFAQPAMFANEEARTYTPAPARSDYVFGRGIRASG